MKALVRHMRNLWQRRHLKRIAIDGLPEFTFETHGPRDIYLSRSIHRDGFWEPGITGLLLKLLQSNADMIDVGANIGWHSIVSAHRLAGRGQVHCFEPAPEHLRVLQANVHHSRLANVVVNGWALSDHAGTAQLNLAPDNLGDHRLGPARDGRRTVQVEVRRLDDYERIGDRPVVIKLDAQGSEWHVLRGAEGLLADHARDVVLVCEVSPGLLAQSGSSLDDLVALLVAQRFAAALINQGTQRIEPIGWSRLAAHMRQVGERSIDAAEDIVAFRRPDGLMRPLFNT